MDHRAPTSNARHDMSTTNAPNLTGDILLDAGTNELEVLVFRLGSGHFGVNVAKVREVIRPSKTVHAPGQHASVIGMFNIRGSVIPVVDLAMHLGVDKRWGTGENAPEGRVIITEFNGIRTGFMVDTVDQIHRMSWQRVRPTPSVNLGGAHAIAEALASTTGVIEMGDKLILMVDFESVADAILIEKRLHVESVPNELGVDRASKRVILAEDSPFMRGLITKVFRNSGYKKLEVYPDGEAAWNAVKATIDGGDAAAPIDAVISDIEMPRMDGLHLTSRIKGNAATKGVPVVLFSSLVSEDNRKKGEQVGADVQIPKPELAEMVRLVDQIVSGQAPATRTVTRAAA
jgi:two-component system chemotaxis response regulator CheV